VPAPTAETVAHVLRPLTEAPEQAGVFLDVDGTLAPIVPRPEDARVPPETRAELRRLHDRYALVACISGRTSEDAQKVVGVPELAYVGNHGLELEPEAEAWAECLHEFLRQIEWPGLVEDKRLSASLHYRNAPEARDSADAIADAARSAGFEARFGRKVLEILPPVPANKGTAVRRLLALHQLERALYAGDDTTDLDAFAALGSLKLGIRVAVASPEAPAALAAAADIVVANPLELVGLLRRL
jgi:trehalose 6-phosphate phosphatase